MAFAVFFASIVLATVYADQCQIALMDRCIKAHQADLKATSETMKDRCFRQQRLVNCIATEPECGGELIEKFRYWLLQVAMMDKFLGTCQDGVDFSALKSIVQQSGIGKARGFVEDVEHDAYDACAVEVHNNCLRYYLSLLIRDHNMCDDSEKLSKCYGLYSERIGCKSQIIQRYAGMVEDVAHRVVELVQGHLKSLCKAEL